jgi:hypothetical protein
MKFRRKSRGGVVVDLLRWQSSLRKVVRRVEIIKYSGVYPCLGDTKMPYYMELHNMRTAGAAVLIIGTILVLLEAVYLLFAGVG